MEERDGSAALVGSASISALKRSPDGSSTWIKLELPYSGGGAGLGDRDDYQDIDRCCPPANIKTWHQFVSKHLRTKGKHGESDHKVVGLQYSAFRNKKVS